MPNSSDKDDKKKNNLDINIDVTYKDEQAVNNGEVLSSEGLYRSETCDFFYYHPKNNTVIHNVIYKTDDYVGVKPLTMTDLAKDYSNNGKSIEQTLENLKNFINTNIATNKEAVYQTVSTLMENMRAHFDHTESASGAGSSKEIFEKCITSDGSRKEIKGLVCGPIVSAMADILQKCNIPASIVPEINNVRHATLVYRPSDNEYVFNNYGENVVIKASNIKDAIAEYSKREDTIHSSGNKRIVNGTKTYSEYAFRDAAFRGEELDIHTYNEDSPFAKTLKQNSSINGFVEKSNLGNTTVDLSVDIANSDKNKETLFSANAGFNKKDETSMFLSSKSFGLGLSYDVKKEKKDGTKFFGIKCQAAQITGTQGGIKYTDASIYKNAREQILADIENHVNNIDLSVYNEEEQAKLLQNIADERKYVETTGISLKKVAEPEFNKHSDLTFFGRWYLGKEHNLIKSDNTAVKGTCQSTADIAFSFDGPRLNHTGDFRVAVEAGLEADNKGDKHDIKASVSGGIVTDYNEQYETGFSFFNFGTKLNSDVTGSYNPSNNTSVGFKGNAYSVNTPSARTYGYGGNVYAAAKDKKHNITFSANAGIKYLGQRIKLGFDEQTENRTITQVELGVQKKNTSLVLGFDKQLDKLNSTRNYSVARVGVRVNL